ncbi:MAG: TIGR02996 domain-containing protein [Kofleriaceae bacterium]
MADESRFLAILTERPDDLAARSVYADWLEEQGDLKRAKLLRLHAAIWDGKARKKQRDELLALGTGLDAHWLAIVAYPRILDTSWTGSNSTELDQFILRFLPGGAFDYIQVHDTTAGTWHQIGNVILVDVNQYSKREGVIAGDEMRGSSWNVDGLAWKWTATRLGDD